MVPPTTLPPTPRVLERRFGGFDPIRLSAALLVVFAHSFDLTGHTADKPGFQIGHQQIRLGRIGVDIFFVISGFLISASWERSHSVADFIRKRVVRVWPALILVTTVSVAVLGPIATKLSLTEYVTSSGTYDYLWHNSTLVFGMRHELPGVFTDLPQDSVNGSLWTLPYEIWGYIVVMVLGLSGQLRRGPVVYALFAATLWVFHGYVIGDITGQRRVFGMSARDGAELAVMFFLGAILSRFRNRLDPRVLLGAGAPLIVAALLLDRPELYLVGLGCSVIGAGALEGSLTRGIHRLGDPSYGIYLWSYPMQQVIYATGIATTPAPMVVVSFAGSLAIGYASWYRVERPAMARFGKKHLR